MMIIRISCCSMKRARILIESVGPIDRGLVHLNRFFLDCDVFRGILPL
jgi:hypothetical protein